MGWKIAIGPRSKALWHDHLLDTQAALRSRYAISLIWDEKRCVSDMFDIINVFVL